MTEGVKKLLGAREVSKDDVVARLNREIIPVLIELRQRFNELVMATSQESYILCWAANGAGTGSGTKNYLLAWGGNTAPNADLTLVPSAIVIPDDGVLDMLFARHNFVAVGSTIITYAIEVAPALTGVPAATALAAQLAVNAPLPSTASDQIHSIAVKRGDIVFCTSTNPGSTNSTLRPNISVRFRRTIVED